MYFNRHGGSQANILRQISNRGLVHPLTRTGREQAAVSAALREFDCGVAEGRADETGWQMWQAVFDDWTVHRRWERRIEGGESFYDVRDRFVPFIEGLVTEYGSTDANLLCVAHGGMLWMMLPLVLTNVNHDLMSQHGFGHTTCIGAELRPDGLRCVEWDGVAI